MSERNETRPQALTKEGGGDLPGEGIVGKVEEAEPGEATQEPGDAAGEEVAADVELAEIPDRSVLRRHPAGEPVAEERHDLERPEAGERSRENTHEVSAVDEDLHDSAGVVAENAGEVAAGVAPDNPGSQRAARVSGHVALELEQYLPLRVRRCLRLRSRREEERDDDDDDDYNEAEPVPHFQTPVYSIREDRRGGRGRSMVTALNMAVGSSNGDECSR